MDFVLPVAILGLLSVAAWVYMALFRGKFWKTDVRLPEPAPGQDDWPRVAVIVPARNESRIIPRTLPSLLSQDYPGAYQVFVVDDGSSDGTAETARALAEAAGPGDRLTVVEGMPPEEGWSGKVWAMQQGFEESADFRADFLLLTDADIRHPRDNLRKLASKAVSGDFDAISVMAKLSVTTGWERLLIPAFVYFFAMLYPFRWVADAKKRTAAAAGGCLMVRQAALEKAGGFAGISDRLIDDCSLASAIRDSGGRSWLGYSEKVESVRGYGGPGDIWRMVSRSAYEQLSYSPLILSGTVIGLGMVFGAPALAAVAGAVAVLANWPGSPAAWTGLVSGAAAWAIMWFTFVPVLRMHRVGKSWGFTLPLAAILYLCMTLDSARRHHTGVQVTWKGRRATRAKPHRP